MRGVLFAGGQALLNRLTIKPYERGYYPLSLCLVGCLVRGSYGNYVALAGAAGTWVAFVVASKRVLGWPPSKSAYLAKKTLVWAHVLRLYFLASLGSWGYICYRLATSSSE